MAKEKVVEIEKSKINKNAIIGVVIVVILIAAAYQFYNKEIVEKEKRNADILNYKKAFYESVVCQYSCPLKMQNVSNTKQLLPEVGCVKVCTENFQKIKNQNYTKEELYNDNLAVDMASVIQTCGRQSINNQTSARNNTLFFECSSRDLKALSEKYSYIFS